MAHLVGKTITNLDWQKAEDVLGIKFIELVVYTLQSRNDTLICEKATKPLADEGFLINQITRPIKYKYNNDGTTLWIKTTPMTSIFNIAI